VFFLLYNRSMEPVKSAYFERDLETLRWETYTNQDELDTKLEDLAEHAPLVEFSAINLAQLLVDNVLADLKGTCTAVLVLQSNSDPDARILEVLDEQISLLWENNKLLYVFRPEA